MRDIFQRVDHAFKKRKDENQVLALTVNDLENHLQYLESQTHDQVEATAQLNLALSIARNHVSKIDVDVREFDEQNLDDFKRTYDDLSSYFHEGAICFSMHFYGWY